MLFISEIAKRSNSKINSQSYIMKNFQF